MIYLNGAFKTNVSAGIRSYTATGLAPDTGYTISAKTVDTSGNINATAVTHTARTAPSPVNTSGIIGLWTFNEASGNIVYDTSENANNGIINGANRVNGISGSGLYFDGISNYVNITNSPGLNPANEITLEAWIKPNNVLSQGWNKIIAKPFTSPAYPWQQYALTLYNGRFFFELNTNGSKSEVSNSIALENDTWYYVVGTYDGSEMKIYVNGELNGTLPKSGIIPSYPTNLHIGAGIYSGLNTEFINGTIDEVRILDRDLSAQEVKAAYEAKLPDSTAPSSVTSLINTTFSPTSITWMWSDPSDPDLSLVMIYLNGTFKTNVSAGIRSYTASGLTPDTEYTISAKTVDTSGNMNETAVTHTARTALSTAITTGIIGSWTFDLDSGNISYDNSGNANNGFINGAIPDKGVNNSGLYFNGVNNYVNIKNSPGLNPANEITLEAWIKPKNLLSQSWTKIIAKPFTSSADPYQQYALTINNGKFVFELNTNGSKSEVSNSISLKNDTWYYVVGTYDGSEMKIYVNGELDGTLPKSGTIPSYPTDLHIGAGIYSGLNTEFVNGTIDEVRILDRDLSAEEIKAVYEADFGMYDANQDGTINEEDLDFLADIMMYYIPCTRCDVNKNGVLDLYDIVLVSTKIVG
jgi:hypothetical protein